MRCLCKALGHEIIVRRDSDDAVEVPLEYIVTTGWLGRAKAYREFLLKETSRQALQGKTMFIAAGNVLSASK